MSVDRVVRGELEDQFIEFAMATSRQTYDVHGIYTTSCFSPYELFSIQERVAFRIRRVLK